MKKIHKQMASCRCGKHFECERLTTKAPLAKSKKWPQVTCKPCLKKRWKKKVNKA